MQMFLVVDIIMKYNRTKQYKSLCDKYLKTFSCRGRYGIVQKCISKKTQEAVAAKYLRLRTKKRLEIRREADLHQRLLHPHIIAFFDAYEAGRNLIIVMEMLVTIEYLMLINLPWQQLVLLEVNCWIILFKLRH